MAVLPAVAAKLDLYSVMRAHRVTKIELARRLGIGEAAVRELAEPDQRSHIGQMQKASRAVGAASSSNSSPSDSARVLSTPAVHSGPAC